MNDFMELIALPLIAVVWVAGFFAIVWLLKMIAHHSHRYIVYTLGFIIIVAVVGIVISELNYQRMKRLEVDLKETTEQLAEATEELEFRSAADQEKADRRDRACKMIEDENIRETLNCDWLLKILEDNREEEGATSD